MSGTLMADAGIKVDDTQPGRGPGFLRIVLVYAGFSILWICGSDWLLFSRIPAGLVVEASVIKGALFVAVTSALLYLLLRQHMGKVSMDRRRIEDSELRLRMALDASDQWIFDCNFTTGIIHFGAGYGRVLGYESASFRETHDAWMDRTHPADRDRVKTAYQACSRGQSPRFRAEFRLCARNGDWRWIQAMGQVTEHDDSGKPVHMIGIHSDVTDSKEASNRISAVENLLAKVFASLNEAVLVVDSASRTILQCNAAAERLFGHSSKELIGQSTQMLHVNRENYEEFGTLSQAVLPRSGVFHTEFQMKRKDGTRFLTENTVTVINDDRGWKNGVVSVVRDITEQKRAEEDLLQFQTRLRALTVRMESLREEERTRISREIHDELGQALTGLKMDLRWIERRLSESQDPSFSHPILERIVSGTELVDQTIGTVQKIAADLRPGALDNLGLGPALKIEIRRFQERTGISCRLQVPESSSALPPEVAIGLFRIFQEALTNVARHARATRVDITLQCQDPMVLMEIKDNGRGIAPENLTAQRSLGLLGMQERANQLGGSLFIRGAPDGGTMVRVKVPLCGPQNEEVAKHAHLACG